MDLLDLAREIYSASNQYCTGTVEKGEVVSVALHTDLGAHLPTRQRWSSRDVTSEVEEIAHAQ